MGDGTLDKDRDRGLEGDPGKIGKPKPGFIPPDLSPHSADPASRSGDKWRHNCPQEPQADSHKENSEGALQMLA